MSSVAPDLRQEIEVLRARIVELELELVEQTAWANAAVAAAQERTYWLDRWHLDLNELMRRRGSRVLQAAARAVLPVARRVLTLRRRLRD